jgi:hypothetical protein
VYPEQSDAFLLTGSRLFIVFRLWNRQTQTLLHLFVRRGDTGQLQFRTSVSLREPAFDQKAAEALLHPDVMFHRFDVLNIDVPSSLTPVGEQRMVLVTRENLQVPQELCPTLSPTVSWELQVSQEAMNVASRVFNLHTLEVPWIKGTLW